MGKGMFQDMISMKEDNTKDGYCKQVDSKKRDNSNDGLFQLGVDGVKAGTMSHTMKWFMRAMPFIMLPLISNFPAVSTATLPSVSWFLAVLCYFVVGIVVRCPPGERETWGSLPAFLGRVLPRA